MMPKISSILTTALLCFLSHSTSKELILPVQIQVYYETLCPDSIDFISQQLYPTYQNLGKYLNIEFVPFGFASYLPDSNGGWNFACQHGPNECSGNLYQACLANAMKNDNALLVEVINCIMSDISPHTATEKCMENLMITEPSYEEMDQCHSSEKGENLLHDFGVQTDALNPSCYFIPWITIDNVWDEAEFSAALVDFQGLLCSDRLADKPECN